MKKSSILILIIICLVGCKKGSNETTITGEIKGLGTDTLYLYGMDELYDRIDTIYVENDKFSYTTSVDTITSAYLLLKNRIEYPVFLDKGNKIKIKGDTINLNFLTISGNIVHLTPIEYKILVFLAQNCGKVMRYSSIINNVCRESKHCRRNGGRVHTATSLLLCKPLLIRQILRSERNA